MNIKKIILFSICIFLSSCNNNSTTSHSFTASHSLTATKTESLPITQESWHLLQRNNITLSDFDKKLIGLAVKNNDLSLCNKISYPEYCKLLVKKENKLLTEHKCDMLVYLKDKCYDELYFSNFKCDNIKNILLKKQCFQQYKLKEAIEKNDKSYCKTLPRIKQKECLQHFK